MLLQVNVCAAYYTAVMEGEVYGQTIQQATGYIVR